MSDPTPKICACGSWWWTAAITVDYDGRPNAIEPDSLRCRECGLQPPSKPNLTVAS